MLVPIPGGQGTHYGPQAWHSALSPLPRADAPSSTFPHPIAVKRYERINIPAFFAFFRAWPLTPTSIHLPFLLRGTSKTIGLRNVESLVTLV
jgi:hypothetical protein